MFRRSLFGESEVLLKGALVKQGDRCNALIILPARSAARPDTSRND